MSYATDTILVRDEPQGNVLDKLKVVGPSPISTTAVGAWGAGAGDAIIVQPIGEPGEGEEAFAGPQQITINQANSLYTVDYEPDPAPTHIESPRAGRAVRQLTAEEQFRLAAKEEKKGKTQASVRKRTRIGGAE